MTQVPSHQLSRRAFLGSTAMALAAAGWKTSVGAEQATDGASKVLVGAHPWVYAAIQPEYDITPVLPDVFADMSYAGLDGIELMHNVLRSSATVDRIAELSAKHRLPVLGTSFHGQMWDRNEHQKILDDAELVLPRLAKLGGRTLGTSVGETPQKKTPEQCDAQAELVQKLITLCEAHGVVLNLHNHTSEVVDDMYDLKSTLARVPDVKLGPDLNWLVRGGVDPAAFLRQFGNKIVFLHLRDQNADGRWSESLGEGAMDYAAIAKALHAIPFQGIAAIELAHERGFPLTRPLRESLKMSREFTRRVLGY